MKCNFLNTVCQTSLRKPFKRDHGFGLAEVLLAASAGVVLISASALALRSTGSLINKMHTKSRLQQNTTSGKRLMRSEIERSLHLLIRTDEAPKDHLLHTDITHRDYQVSLNQCKDLAEKSQTKEKHYGFVDIV